MDLILVHPYLYQKGGGERVVLEIAKKFNPIIYTSIYQPENTFQEFKEFDIRSLPQSIFEKPFFFLKNDFRRSRTISAGFQYYLTKIKEDYDVINAHGSPSEWIRNRNERVCWYCYSPNREAFDLYDLRMKKLSFSKRILNIGILSVFKAIEYPIVNKIEKIIAISEITNERIKKYLFRNDAIIIPSGINEKEFYNKDYKKYFFYPSRIVPEKRFEYAIDAFREFNKNQLGWKLILAGFLLDNENDKKYVQTLKRLSIGLDVEFRFNPSEQELREMYANAYCVLFCAINEDWGLTPIEAMASEKPCISVNEGGPTYTIIDGITGYLIDSPIQMAEKMIYLAENPNENEKMGKNGKKHIHKNYTWKIFLDKLESVFKEVAVKKTKEA